MKHALLFALAGAALLSACTNDRPDTADNSRWSQEAAPDTVVVVEPAQPQVIILPGYYGASHYANNPGAYYRDPHSAYFDQRSSAYHRPYAQEVSHEAAATGRRWATSTRANTSAPRTYTMPRTTPALKPATRTYSAPRYNSYGTTTSKVYSAPAATAPARTYSAPTRTYSAPHTYSAPSRSYSAPHTYSAPHVSVSAHH